MCGLTVFWVEVKAQKPPFPLFVIFFRVGTPLGWECNVVGVSVTG